MGWIFKKSKKGPETEKKSEVKEMDVKIPDQVKELLGKRGIKEADVKEVINSAESTGKKLASKDGTKLLAKKRIGDTTMYAQYIIQSGAVNLMTAYSHRIALGNVVNQDGEADWRCEGCREPAVMGHVEMTYMEVTRNGPAIICPHCKDTFAEEYLAAGTMAAVEGLFEKKRA